MNDVPSNAHEQDNFQLTLKRQVRQNEILAQISMIFAAHGDFDAKTYWALQLIGEFLNIDRVYLLKDHPNEYHYTRVVVWLNDKVSSTASIDGSKFPNDVWYEKGSIDHDELAAGSSIIFSDSSKLEASRRKSWVMYDIMSLISIPLMVNNKMWGVLSFDCYNKPHEWLDNEVKLAQTVAGIISTATERMEMETELFSTRKTLRTVIDNLPSYVLWKDKDLIIRGCNNRYAELFNKKEEDLIGKTDFDLFPHETALANRELDLQVFTLRSPILNIEHQYTFPFGNTMWINICEMPMMGSNGDIETLLVVITDITDLKNAEFEMIKRDLALEEATKIAVQSNKAKSEFLSRMSHEIRTPLTAIIGMTHIASSSSDMSAIKSYLSKVDSSSRQLLNIVNDILDMSKIEANKFEIAHEVFDIEKALFDIRNIITVRADEKSQSFQISIDADVPRLFKGDVIHFSQVVINLLTNAVKFTPDKGIIRLHVSVQSIKENTASITVTITDTGIGITPEQCERIFTSFEQADGGIARRYGGTGLGLAICKSIVELMNGTIGVESAKGEGSKFFFTIPLEVVPSDAVSDTHAFDYHAPAQAASGDDSPPDLTGKTVMVAEDVEINREIIRLLLSDSNVIIEEAEDGAAAISLFKHNPDRYNLILMDMQMPVMNGLDATMAIRSLPCSEAAKIPILAMTANAFTEDIERCLAAGMDGHLAKPIDNKVFYSMLRRYLLSPLSDKENSITSQRTENAYLPYINIHTAIEHVKGNRKLFDSMLNSFTSNNTFASLTKAFYSSDLENTTVYTHKLSAAATNLSLTELLNKTQILENALQLDDVFIEFPFNTLEETYEKTLNLITEYFNERGDKNE